MARNYKRDQKGRFSSGGGMGGGKKGTSTRAKNTARAGELRAKGTTAVGGRVKAAGFSGGKAAQTRAGGLRSTAVTALKGGKSTAGAGTRSKLKANAAQVGRNRSRAASAGTSKMSKAPVSAAKARYKQLSGEARKSKTSAYRSAAENRRSAGAKRSLNTMIKKRGRK